MGDWSAARAAHYQYITEQAAEGKFRVARVSDDGPPELVPPDEFRCKAHWHDASQGPDHPLDALAGSSAVAWLAELPPPAATERHRRRASISIPKARDI